MKEYFGIFTRSLKSFAKDLQELKGNIEQLERQREDILYAPACRADVLAAVGAWVQKRRDEHRAYLVQQISRLIPAAEKLSDLSLVGEQFRSNPLLARLPFEFRGVELDGALAWLLSDQFEAALRQTIEAMPWPDEGMPYVQRAGAVEKIDAELAKVRNEYDELVAEAAKHGLGVE